MLQCESDFAYDISWCVIVLTYVEINCFYFSQLLEKTSDGILKAAKLGDLKTVSGISESCLRHCLFLSNLCSVLWDAFNFPDLFHWDADVL